MINVNYSDIFVKDTDKINFTQFGNFSNKSILITGSRGMLGGGLSATIIEYVKNNPQDTITIFLASRNWGALKPLRFFNSSVIYISNSDARARLHEFNFIIHCASPSNFSKVTSYEDLLDINQKYLEDCIGDQTECVTYISSGEVYGGESTTTLPSRKNLMATGDRGFYPLAKLATEEFLTQLNQNQGLKVKTLRLFHTFGPGLSRDDGRSFSDFLYAGADNNPICLKTNGKQVRSFLYLADAVRAVFHFTLASRNYEIHNIGSDIPVRIEEFAEMVAEVTRQKVVFVPEDGYVKSPFSLILPDIETARAEGWRPHTNLADSVNLTIQWIRKSNYA